MPDRVNINPSTSPRSEFHFFQTFHFDLFFEPGSHPNPPLSSPRSMADARSTKRLRRSEERPQPTIFENEWRHGPMVYFDSRQAWDYFGTTSPLRYYIGDAVALVQNYGQRDILDYLTPRAINFIQSEIVPDNDYRRFEVNATVLALCIGRTMYEVRPDGLMSPCKLLNVFTLRSKQAFEVVYEDEGQALIQAMVDFQNLETKSGLSLHLEQLPCEGAPRGWLIDWTCVRYQRHIGYGAPTLPNNLGGRNGASTVMELKR